MIYGNTIGIRYIYKYIFELVLSDGSFRIQRGYNVQLHKIAQLKQRDNTILSPFNVPELSN